MKDLDEIVQLQELVDQAFKAVGNIGPSELRLMNREVRAALASFMVEAESVVVLLALARDGEAGTRDVVTGVHMRRGVEHEGLGEDCLICWPDGSEANEPNPTPGQVVRGVAGADEGEPAVASGLIDGLPDAPPLASELEGGYQADDAEGPAMCPQTKNGVPCNRPLHNVGLHTPDGYPENGSWTDKESD